MPLIISSNILDKLAGKHKVSRREVEQCFINIEAGLLQDKRASHKTIPPTLWFIAPTNHNRLLKIVFIQDGKDVYIKTAYEPNADELNRYQRFAY